MRTTRSRAPVQGSDGLQPNAATGNRLLRACVEQGQLEAGREIYKRLAALNLALDVDLVKQLGGPSAYAARLTGGTPPPRSPPTS